MDLRIGIRDRRNPGWYRVDNEVYDIPMSCEALAVYNAIARFATNETERAYFSGKKWKKHHKVGNGKLSKGIRELIDHKLIRPTGEKTGVGAPYYELCNIDHIKKTLFQGGTGGCSEAEQGGVPSRNTSKTKTDNKDFSILPQPFKEPKTSKKKDISKESIELSSPIYKILEESIYKVEKSKTLTQKIAKAVKLLGAETVRKGTLARIEYMRKAGKDLYFHSFIEDDEAVTWQASMYKDPSSGWHSQQRRLDSEGDLSALQKTLAVL